MTSGCSVAGCDNPERQRGMCQMHYMRAYRAGTLPSLEKPFVSRDGQCLVDGCESPRYADGYCQVHYARKWRHGHTDKMKTGRPAKPKSEKSPKQPRTCSVLGCDRKHSGLGYCDMHLQRYKKWGNPLVASDPQKQTEQMPKVCTVPDCGRKVNAKGLCWVHYQRQRRYGDPRADIPIKERGAISVSTGSND